MAGAPTRITLVRHAETRANIDQIYHGPTNAPITELGHRQIARVATRLAETHAGAGALYASPIERAQVTARAIEERMGLPVRTEAAFAEVDIGAWEGLPYRVLHETHDYFMRSNADPHFAEHGGESVHAAVIRWTEALKAAITAHEGGHFIVVSHGYAMAASLAHLFGDEPLVNARYQMKNCAVTELEFRPDPALVLFNCARHLQDLS